MLILILAEEITALVDGTATTALIITAEEVQQLVVTLFTFQQTPQATVRCVGKYEDLRKELWMPSTLMHMHMERLIGIHQILLHHDH